MNLELDSSMELIHCIPYRADFQDPPGTLYGDTRWGWPSPKN